MKFSHTRYWALDPELIPVFRWHPRSDFSSHPRQQAAITFRLWSPSRSKNVTVLRPVPSYTAWWQCACVNNLPKVVTQPCPSENWTHNLLIARNIHRGKNDYETTQLPPQRFHTKNAAHHRLVPLQGVTKKIEKLPRHSISNDGTAD